MPVIVLVGLSPARRRALAIADNKIADNAGWDRERLAIEIPDLAGLLETEGLEVSILGFEALEIDQLATDFEANAADPEDRIDPNWLRDSAVSKPGDLWVLGPHMLLCGDARSAADIAYLMAHCRADMAFLDPPHNVGIGGVVGRGKTKHSEFAMVSGEDVVRGSRQACLCRHHQHRGVGEIERRPRLVLPQPTRVCRSVSGRAGATSK